MMFSTNSITDDIINEKINSALLDIERNVAFELENVSLGERFHSIVLVTICLPDRFDKIDDKVSYSYSRKEITIFANYDYDKALVITRNHLARNLLNLLIERTYIIEEKRTVFTYIKKLRLDLQKIMTEKFGGLDG